jgi:hypothetical protein
MVNQFRRYSGKNSFTIQASWMGSLENVAVARLADQLLHHPHKADGVDDWFSLLLQPFQPVRVGVS